jgi:ATP-dependent Zn protease
MISFLAGQEAEFVAIGKYCGQLTNRTDMENATGLSEEFVQKNGLTAKTDKIIEWGREKAREFLREHKPLLDRLAEELMKRKELSGEELDLFLLQLPELADYDRPWSIPQPEFNP